MNLVAHSNSGLTVPKGVDAGHRVLTSRKLKSWKHDWLQARIGKYGEVIALGRHGGLKSITWSYGPMPYRDGGFE